MNTEFHHLPLVRTIQDKGFPKSPKAKQELFLEMDFWMASHFPDFAEKEAAIHLGCDIFQAPDGLAVMFIALQLQRRRPEAFEEFKSLVHQELMTGHSRQKLQEQAHTRAEAALAANPPPPPAKVQKFTREEFYELVWSQPAKTLGAELGISDVMIGKICKKYDIPKPYKGYWNKYYAGETPNRRPLPKRKHLPSIVVRGR